MYNEVMISKQPGCGRNLATNQRLWSSNLSGRAMISDGRARLGEVRPQCTKVLLARLSSPSGVSDGRHVWRVSNHETQECSNWVSDCHRLGHALGSGQPTGPHAAQYATTSRR